MNPSRLGGLRRLAREAGVSPASLAAALECGLFVPEASPTEWAGELRKMRGLMVALGVNAPGAALLVRMQREMQTMQLQLERLDRLEARWFDDWDEGFWRDLAS